MEGISFLSKSASEISEEMKESWTKQLGSEENLMVDGFDIKKLVSRKLMILTLLFQNYWYVMSNLFLPTMNEIAFRHISTRDLKPISTKRRFFGIGAYVVSPIDEYFCRYACTCGARIIFIHDAFKQFGLSEIIEDIFNGDSEWRVGDISYLIRDTVGQNKNIDDMYAERKINTEVYALLSIVDRVRKFIVNKLKQGFVGIVSHWDPMFAEAYVELLYRMEISTIKSKISDTIFKCSIDYRSEEDEEEIDKWEKAGELKGSKLLTLKTHYPLSNYLFQSKLLYKPFEDFDFRWFTHCSKGTWWIPLERLILNSMTALVNSGFGPSDIEFCVEADSVDSDNEDCDQDDTVYCAHKRHIDYYGALEKEMVVICTEREEEIGHFEDEAYINVLSRSAMLSANIRVIDMDRTSN